MAIPSRSMFGVPFSGTSASKSSRSKKYGSAEWAQIIAAAISAYSAYNTNKKRQRFARDMSNTAHQREVRDLRAAGLNPILSAGGRGASTPDPALISPGKDLVAASGLANIRKLQKQQIAEGKAGARLTNAKAQYQEVENIRQGIMRTPWQMLDDFLKSGEMPDIPEGLESLKGIMDKFGTTQARPESGKMHYLPKQPWDKGRFKKNRSNWNKAPKNPFRLHYTPQNRGKNRRD